MTEFSSWLRRLAEAYWPQVTVQPAVRVVGPCPTRTVAPPPRFAWDEKHWRRIIEGRTVQHVGAYRVRHRRQNIWRFFDGRVVEDAGTITAYVADPPIEIKRHAKGPCFQLVRAPWFRVHWHRAPHTVDEALLYVERLLDECLNHPPQ